MPKRGWRLNVLVLLLSMGSRSEAAMGTQTAKIVCPAGTTKQEAGTDAHETWCQRHDGSRHGPYRRVWQNTHEEGQYRNGKRHGPWVEASGAAVARGSYVDDQEEGVWTFFYEGKKSARGAYRHGRRNGTWTFFLDGRVTERGVYLNGAKHGRWSFFLTPPGTTVLECHGGRPHGLLVQRDERGQLLRRGAYVEGIMVGWWMEQLGAHLARGRYEGGKLVEGEAIDTAGEWSLGFHEGILGHHLCKRDFEQDYRVVLR